MGKKSIGSFISALRKVNGMTQQELADKLGVSNKAVSRWERDECAPDISIIPVIAEIFNVSCDELLRGERVSQLQENEIISQKCEKQMQQLVERTIYKFKSQNYISWGITATGIILLFCVSYTFFKPLIGFGLSMILNCASVLIALLSISKLNLSVANSGIVDDYNTKIQLVRYKYSFISFFSNIIAVIIALPFVLYLSEYVDNVIRFYSYLTLVPYLFLGSLSLYIIFKYYYKQFMLKEIAIAVADRKNPIIRNTNVTQCIIGTLILFCYEITIRIEASNVNRTSIFVGIGLIIILCLFIANILSTVLFAVSSKENKKEIILTGIRNFMVTVGLLWIIQRHMYWVNNETVGRFTYNHMNLLIGLSIIVITLLIYTAVENKVEKNNIK